MNSSALAKRPKSPISATSPSAIKGVDTTQAARPADQRRDGGSGSERVDLTVERLDPRVDEVECVQVVVERRLPGRLLEPSLEDP